MAFTMHSHSGQFCPGHAVDQLEDVVRHAISIGYKTIGLTEHMPRYDERDLYPEELEDPKASLALLQTLHAGYLVEAKRLQQAYASQIHIIIGIEGEFIRPEFGDHVRRLVDADTSIDYFMGSLHHVHSIPIDYSKERYADAVAVSSAPQELALYEDYYDEQFEMLRSLRPRIVGHFDLIRLMSSDPGRDVREWPSVWSRIRRNLDLVHEQGGWLECNSSALRKGLAEPYPARPIAEYWLSLGGKFTMSDDSHGIAQVATNYARALTYLESLGVKEVWTFKRTPHPGVEGNQRATLEDVSVPLSTFREHFPNPA